VGMKPEDGEAPPEALKYHFTFSCLAGLKERKCPSIFSNS
jgi:hypothetical protein